MRSGLVNGGNLPLVLVEVTVVSPRVLGFNLRKRFLLALVVSHASVVELTVFKLRALWVIQELAPLAVPGAHIELAAAQNQMAINGLAVPIIAVTAVAAVE